MFDCRGGGDLVRRAGACCDPRGEPAENRRREGLMYSAVIVAVLKYRPYMTFLQVEVVWMGMMQVIRSAHIKRKAQITSNSVRVTANFSIRVA